MKQRNISIFVPHLGCPHHCIFCNQRSITGKISAPSEQDVFDAVQIASSQHFDYTELAFFGGSFTAVPRDYMLSLLHAANVCIKEGLIDGIRISTRPDCVSDKILRILKGYRVTAIELGAQSMQEKVLSLCERGHTSQEVEDAAHRIKSYGFSLGLQMMTGLPGDTVDGAMNTAQRLAGLYPDTMRIYPAITLRGTKMADMFAAKEYTPPSMEDSIALCAKLLVYFEKLGIKVIKMGLQYEKSLEKDYIAGPFHPAFCELCQNDIYLQASRSGLSEYGLHNEENVIEVARGELSKMIGQKKKNIQVLNKLGWKIKIKENDSLQKWSVLINGKMVRDI